jgi:uncharacterized coiled-coil protein SlyX
MPSTIERLEDLLTEHMKTIADCFEAVEKRLGAIETTLEAQTTLLKQLLTEKPAGEKSVSATAEGHPKQRP